MRQRGVIETRKLISIPETTYDYLKELAETHNKFMSEIITIALQQVNLKNKTTKK